VTRNGDHSLHQQWCDGSHSWDLAVSYWGGNEHKVFPEARYVHRLKGTKMKGYFAFFQDFPDLLEAYDYFWLPDDDIAASAAVIEQMFEIMRDYDLALAQPSLSPDSYMSHLITLQNPVFRLRFTTFVEVMCPVLSRDMLKTVLPILKHSAGGTGLDFAWARFIDEPYGKSAILDEISVTHTRPVGGGSLHTLFAAKCQAEEIARMMQRLEIEPRPGFVDVQGVKVPPILVYGGITRKGRRFEGPAATALAQLHGYLPLAHRLREPGLTPIAILRYIAKHLLRPMPDLSPLALRIAEPV
jgi:hypothetical protein